MHRFNQLHHHKQQYQLLQWNQHNPAYKHRTLHQHIQLNKLINLKPIHNLCSKINRKGSLDECLTQLSRTKTIECNKKACACIICHCSIIGVEKICWLAEENLIAKYYYLSVDFLEATTN